MSGKGGSAKPYTAASLWQPGGARGFALMARAFSSEVDTGSREENASKQEFRASVLIQSEPIML
jgi:hypothetical protein